MYYKIHRKGLTYVSKRFIGNSIIFRLKNGQIASIMLWYLSVQGNTIKIMYNVLVINIFTSYSYFGISMARHRHDETKKLCVYNKNVSEIDDLSSILWWTKNRYKR